MRILIFLILRERHVFINLLKNNQSVSVVTFEEYHTVEVLQKIYFELDIVVVLLKNVIFVVNSARSNISDIFFSS